MALKLKIDCFARVCFKKEPAVSGTCVEDFTPHTGRRSFLLLTWRHGMNCIAAAGFPHQRTRHPVARV